MSVNQAQLLFLFTFTATLATLIFSAHFLDRKLSAAGYDIRNIILIGLEEKKPLTNSNLSEAEMSVIKTIQSNTYAQVFALVVVVTTGVLYRRFVAAPASMLPCQLYSNAASTTDARFPRTKTRAQWRVARV